MNAEGNELFPRQCSDPRVSRWIVSRVVKRGIGWWGLASRVETVARRFAAIDVVEHRDDKRAHVLGDVP